MKGAFLRVKTFDTYASLRRQAEMSRPSKKSPLDAKKTTRPVTTPERSAPANLQRGQHTAKVSTMMRQVGLDTQTQRNEPALTLEEKEKVDEKFGEGTSGRIKKILDIIVSEKRNGKFYFTELTERMLSGNLSVTQLVEIEKADFTGFTKAHSLTRKIDFPNMTSPTMVGPANDKYNCFASVINGIIPERSSEKCDFPFGKVLSNSLTQRWDGYITYFDKQITRALKNNSLEFDRIKIESVTDIPQHQSNVQYIHIYSNPKFPGVISHVSIEITPGSNTHSHKFGVKVG